MKSLGSWSCQKGMTLIEIMIALLIGAFLLAGVLQIFLNTKQTYRMTEAQSRLQENGRYALEILNNDLRMTGFQGCPSLATVPSTVGTPTGYPSAPSLTNLATVTGYQGSTATTPTNTWSPALPTVLAGLSPAIQNGSDVISVIYGSPCGGSFLTATMGGGTPSVTGSVKIQSPTANPANTCGIANNDVLMISDCGNADIFRATSVTSTTTVTTITHTTTGTSNSSASLSKAYDSSAEVFRYRSYSYFIKPGASGEPALWRLDNANATSASNPIELIEGVENMQILYGEDTDPLLANGTMEGTPNYYVPANSVVNMAKVVSIRVSLLVRSIDDGITTQPVPYTYNGTLTTPAITDKRLRRVFTSTIALRNRLP